MKVETKMGPGVKLPSRDRNPDSGYTSAEKILRPLLMSMKILGMYFDPTLPHNKVDVSDTVYPVRKRSWILGWCTTRMYSYIVLVLLWFNCIRCAVGIVPIDGGVSNRIIFLLWFTQCAVNATFMVASCQRLMHLRSFYKHMDSLFLDSTTEEIGCGFRCPRRVLIVKTAVGWSLFAISLIIIWAFLFGSIPLSQDIVVNLTRPFPEHQAVFIMVAILHIFESAAWIFPVIFVSVVARIICLQFLQFKTSLSKQIDGADGCIPDRLPQLRTRYTQLCKTVEIINGTFKWMLGASFILQVSLACFISYQIIHTPPEIFSLATSVFWLGTCFLCIWVLSISSANVHDAAHSLLEDIFRVGTKDATNEQLGQLNLFVAKLTGTSIGFSAIDFFVITREFVLTLGGLYLTYFFILLQFRIA